MALFTQFSGKARTRQINLSGRPSSSQASNSESLLAKARDERKARERSRLEATSVLAIQRVWRGRRVALQVKGRLLAELDVRLGQSEISEGDWMLIARTLILIGRNRHGTTEIGQQGAVLLKCCERGIKPLTDGTMQILAPLKRNSDYLVTLTLLFSQIFDHATGCKPPKSVQETIQLVQTLLVLLEKSAWEFLNDSPTSSNPQIYVRRLSTETYSLACRRWTISTLVTAQPDGWVGAISAAIQSVPNGQKNYPSLPYLVQLLVLPSNAYPDDTLVGEHIYPAFLHTLLSIPNLTGRLPLASLSTLSAGLHLWDKLIPLASSESGSAMLNGTGLTTEIGKTNLLANLSTIAVRTGMVAKKETDRVAQWMHLLCLLLQGVESGWGLWIQRQGAWQDEEDVDQLHGEGHLDTDIQMQSDSDEDRDAELAGGNKRLREARTVARDKNRLRGRVDPATTSKLMHLFSPQHLNILAEKSLETDTIMQEFTKLIITMLQVFRGSARWEEILDCILESGSGVHLQRQLWLKVRVTWTNTSRSTWETLFTTSPTAKTSQLPSLQLFSVLYLQNLLTLPDDEFFQPVRQDKSRSALTLDEVADLAGIWRDLAFWGYTVGFGNGPETILTKRKEEFRGLMTQGVLAISARNARRKFLPTGFWIMVKDAEMSNFIDTVCEEEQQLEGDDDEDDIMGNESISQDQLRVMPAWPRARRFLSKRQMAKISPRLGLLNNLPMTLPFASRVQIMGGFIHNDHRKFRRYMRRRRIRHSATIRRTHLSEDSFREFNKLGPALKGSIQIVFLDEFGEEEQGIDGGGLFKEWLTSLSKEVFDTDRGLWLATEQNELYPNPHAYAKEQSQLEWYTFIGRMLGKALYEGLLMNVSFAGFFLAKWLGRQSYLDDLASLDYDLYKGLIALKNYPGDPEDMSLTFTLDQEEFGQMKSIELKRNGSNISVTRANRMEYIQLVCDFKLNRQIAPQCEAFFAGLSDIIDPKWLRMFDQQELQTLIGGAESPIDVEDLERNTVMHDGNDPLYKTFWKVVRSLTQEELRSLLKFVTSTPNPPLLGFKYLNPQFGIRLNPEGNDSTRLPTAAACMNLLKLPRYKDERTLKTKLLQAINSNAGFYLS